MRKYYDTTGKTPSDICVVTVGSRWILDSENKWCEFWRGTPEVFSLAQMRERYDFVEVVTEPNSPPQCEYWVSGSIGGDGPYSVNCGAIHRAKKEGQEDLYFFFGSNEEHKKDEAENKKVAEALRAERAAKEKRAYAWKESKKKIVLKK